MLNFQKITKLRNDDCEVPKATHSLILYLGIDFCLFEVKLNLTDTHYLTVFIYLFHQSFKCALIAGGETGINCGQILSLSVFFYYPRFLPTADLGKHQLASFQWQIRPPLNGIWAQCFSKSQSLCVCSSPKLWSSVLDYFLI